MKEHNWSEPVCIYESVCMCKCSGCGAIIFTEEEEPSHDDLRQSRLPEDCDEAIPFVVLEEYAECNMDPWCDEDIGRWTWPVGSGP